MLSKSKYVRNRNTFITHILSRRILPNFESVFFTYCIVRVYSSPGRYNTIVPRSFCCAAYSPFGFFSIDIYACEYCFLLPPYLIQLPPPPSLLMMYLSGGLQYIFPPFVCIYWKNSGAYTAYIQVNIRNIFAFLQYHTRRILQRSRSLLEIVTAYFFNSIQ